MAGAGVVALVELARGPAAARWGLALVACALATTVLAQVVLMHREHYMLWFVPVLAVGAAARLRRAARAAPAGRAARSR